MSALAGSTYVPGSWVAVTAPGAWLLVDLPPEDPVVRRCWKLVSEGAAADAVLDALTAGGVGAAPAFALVRLPEGGAPRVVVRHPAVVRTHAVAAVDEIVVEADPAVSWTDVVLASPPDAITLTGQASPASSVELPMGSGVTTAAVVIVSLATAVTAPAPEPAVEPAVVPEPIVVAEPTVVAEPAVASELEPVASEPETAASEPETAAPEPEPELAPAPEPAPVAPPAAQEQLPSYDFLFGATQRGVVPPPPAQPPAVTIEAPSAEHTATWPTEPPADFDRSVPAGEPPKPSSGGLIDSVPWATSSTEQAPPSSPAPAPVPAPIVSRPSPVDEPPPAVAQTVNRAQLRAAAAATGPTVLAGRCPNGHLSPVHVPTCRVCSAAMPDQDPVEIPRPPLGVLTSGGSIMVTLDKGVLLGRAPDVPPGDDPPHVLRLRSPENDISRNHAEIVIDGWNVYVRDLGSTNGTVVGLPSQPPLRLREQDLQLLTPGSTLSLADEITLTFEVRA
ncbi:MAG: FHA domain-containing protein [Jatrophihabitans sp.]|uniref:FHA domain-containing protein n=1 Tax=Jatrophihabitans sp. TaxID=1932789 RepID=UPI003F7D484D